MGNTTYFNLPRAPNIRCNTSYANIMSLVCNNENGEGKEIHVTNDREDNSSRRRRESSLDRDKHTSLREREIFIDRP